MFDTLYDKTFLILGSQLVITWASTLFLLNLIRNSFYANAAWVAGCTNENGELDLDLDWEAVKPYFWTLFVADIVVFIVLTFLGRDNLTMGIPLFSIWSVLTGLELALCLISVDENLGGRVLGLTALISLGAGLVGAKSGINFSFLEMGLLLSLLALILFGIFRLIFSIPRWIQRVVAFFGVIIFTGYLLFDFHRLSQMSGDGNHNTWADAIQISISIYLDIINLFLELLDLLSK